MATKKTGDEQLASILAQYLPNDPPELRTVIHALLALSTNISAMQFTPEIIARAIRTIVKYEDRHRFFNSLARLTEAVRLSIDIRTNT